MSTVWLNNLSTIWFTAISSIQLTISHEENLLNLAPSCSVNESGCSQPGSKAGKEFKDVPSNSSRQFVRSKPFVQAVCWGRPPVQLAFCYPISEPHWDQRTGTGRLAIPGAEKRRFSYPILRHQGWRWCFVELVTQHTKQGTVRVEEQVLKVGPASFPYQFSSSEPSGWRRISLAEFIVNHDSKEILPQVLAEKKKNNKGERRTLTRSGVE